MKQEKIIIRVYIRILWLPKKQVKLIRIYYQDYIKMIYVFILLKNCLFAPMKTVNSHIFPITLNQKKSTIIENVQNKDSMEFIKTLFSSKFIKELNGELETNTDEIKNFLLTPEYSQILLPYFYDLNKAIELFYDTIIATSVDILEVDYQNYLIYTILYGFSVSSMLFYVIIYNSRRLQRQIRAIRQALILLPHESLLDVQVYSAIKRFEQGM
ncbi:unnamed protein product (macronuclear) [Paramecium tetraurelia]|uniref:Uncharacterized protein n=1 Tax=Paramecium tetraurelia TaxID=5888 RepID=A0CB01_PARTE|nr:uncharacterized protein GSPATT00036751001 [Paramecium tetraurelia]CAK67968.1 unnamed protein product [Paramecium tetraurelia]|eukprot:XP_001435365.1 hypothetical protein (macronuclear) [Paramecium tetraurelia strain d4-2]